MNRESHNLKFLPSEDALNEIFYDLTNPQKWYEFALFAKVYGFLTRGHARPGLKSDTGPDRDERGVWFKAPKAKKEIFIRDFDFKAAAIDLIPRIIAQTDAIARAYEWAMWVKASPGKGPGGENGLWVATEMEIFHCVRCGNCCRNLNDAFATSVDLVEIDRWRGEERWDILDWVDIFEFDGKEAFGDIWVSPTTGEDVSRCPWLRKLPRQDKYKCRIHNTKPLHCSIYPQSKRHALTTGCKGFGNDTTFAEVKRELAKLYDPFPPQG